MQKEIKNAARIETLTNANFRGSSSLYDEGLNKEYFLYRNGTSITLSMISGTDNNAYWYPVVVGDYYFLVNKGNTDYCLCVSGNFNGVSYSPNDYRWDLVFVGLDVPLIMQSTDNNCSAANVLQCLMYLGLDGYVTGDTLSQKMDTIYPSMFDGGIVKAHKLQSYLNTKNNYYYNSPNKITDPYSFTYTSSGSLTIYNALSTCLLTDLYPCIALVTPKDNYSYYKDYPYDEMHFFVIAGIVGAYESNLNNILLIVRDCNRLQSPSFPYFGEFIITLEELMNGSEEVIS